MKNKECLMKKLVNKDVNYNKNYWIFFTAPLVLILAAIIVFACCSFNFTFSFTGGRIITVNYSLTLTDEEYAEREAVVNQLVKDAGIENYTVEKVGQQGAFCTLIKVRTNRNNSVSNETIKGLTSKITEKYKADSPGFEVTNAVSKPFAGNKVVIGFTVSLCVAIVLAFFYLWFRTNLAAGFASVIGVIFTVATTCAFSIITRTPTDEYFLAVLLGAIVLSLVQSMFKFARVERELIENENKTTSNSELVNVAGKSNFMVNAIIDGALFVVLVILLACGPNAVRFISLHLLFALISCVYTNIAIVPSAWIRVYNRKKDKRLVEKLTAVKEAGKEKK